MEHYSQGDTPCSAHSGPSATPNSGALLDLLLPGFGLFAESARQHWGLDLSKYVHIAIGAAIVLYAWSSVKDILLQSLKTVFLSTAEIRPDDVEIYNVVMSWIAAQPSAAQSRRFFVNLNLTSKRWTPWMYDGPDEHEDPVDSTLSFTPSYGTHLLWFRGRPIFLTRSKGEPLTGVGGTTKRDEISLSCLFSPNTLKQLLASAQADYLRKDHDKTVIYRAHMSVDGGASWSRATARLSRPFNTIFTKAGLIESILSDVQDYLSAETKAWYANCGIPWRRGYLLVGPPGTGKSSLSFALAGHFGLKIYTVSLSSPGATEENLSMLFEVLPQSCIVLFEDIDAAGLTQPRTTPRRSRRSRGSSSTQGLSLSSLLNLLDGVASQEGRILVMTTNHVETLDKALIRPGRVDMTLHFGLADEFMISSIFKGVFAHLHQKLSAKTDTTAPETDGKREAEVVKAKIEGMANDFSARIPPSEFSPAELQGYLIQKRRQPEAAVEGARDWVDETRRRRIEEEEELLRASNSGEPAEDGAEVDEDAEDSE